MPVLRYRDVSCLPVFMRGDVFLDTWTAWSSVTDQISPPFSYDCENDGSCHCIEGFTGPDCGLECLPDLERGFNFLNPAGSLAICDCQSGYTGPYCNATIEDGVLGAVIIEKTSSAPAVGRQGHMTVWIAFLIFCLIGRMVPGS